MTHTSKPLFRFRGPWAIPMDVMPSAVIFYALAFALISVGLDWLQGAFWLPVILFVSVFLHELGHAWAVRRQGAQVDRIAFVGFGGFCQFTGANARGALWITLAGPAVNLILAILILLLGVGMMAMMISGLLPIAVIAYGAQAWTLIVIVVLMNLALCFGNLMPFQPLDGGRVVHLSLVRVLPLDRAMRVAGVIGLVSGVIWIPTMAWLLLEWEVIFPVIPNLRTHWRMMFGRTDLAHVLRLEVVPEPAAT
ncbi:MAG: site-2 protease family protein [Pseudomonadota bacterium]